MHIAIASGKGGTGKTTLATNLADVLSARGIPAAYLDCDVEEPNGHIFLRPDIRRRNQVTIPVPEVDLSLCTNCRACAEACRFSAIAALPRKVLTFPALCHGCGGCALACPERAIREVPRPIGTLEEGKADGLIFVHGRLNVGEAMSPPVIRAVLDRAPRRHTIIVDAPPGTSCPVIESIKGADAVLLVTEPTPFGLSDLRLAVGLVRALGVPFGVAVNRADSGDREVFGYCEHEGIPVLFELGDDRRIAKSYARGELATRAIPELVPRFLALAEGLEQLAAEPRARPVSLSGGDGYDHTQPFPTLPSTQLMLKPPHPPRELVVISGKGGTGKTSLVASFFALAGDAVVADCDVDAADLHLVLEPQVRASWPFSGGYEAQVFSEACTACGLCAEYCRFNAIGPSADEDWAVSVFEVDTVSCEGCGVCVDACPAHAVGLVPSASGAWFLSTTRHGPMVHAQLGVAQGNSGKLVSLVRREARAVAMAENQPLLLVDGSPGIGCPVIASITGAHLVLLVSEPTLSAIHDLERVAQLCRHFRVPAALCINKADLDLHGTELMTRRAKEMGLPVLGQVRYDPAVTLAQVQHRAVVECDQGPVVEDIRRLWARVRKVLQMGEAENEKRVKNELALPVLGS